MILDRDTTFVVSALITLVLGLILMVAQGNGRMGAWASCWGLGNIAFGLSNISTILNGVVPDAYRVAGENMTGMIGYGLIVQGGRLLAGYVPRWRIWLAIMFVLVVPLGVAHAPQFKPERIAFNNAVFILGDSWVALLAFQMARKERLNTPWIMAALFAVTVPLACSRLSVTIAAIMGTDTLSHVRSGPWVTAMVATIWSLRGAVPALIIAERGNRELERLACRDQLTGALNRVGLDRCRADISGDTTVLMLDLDHFKPLNDRYGHAQGDSVLRMLVDAASAQLDPGDTLVRLGGDEFLIILPKATASEVAHIAGKIRAAFASATEALNLSAPSPTISMGTATADIGQVGLNELIGDADKALYRAKAQGRDRIAA